MAADNRSDRSWASSDRAVPRLIVRPLRDFLETEIAGGIVLLVAAAIALAWANSPLRDGYHALWTTELSFQLGDWSLAKDLRHWINDGLMAIFFFVVGLEIKRELVKGELSDPRVAAFPVVAAAGGMVVPALLYAAVNAGGEAARGWGIPMATDIAFALGALALFGRGAPTSLRVFLLSLAIVDDIGAIVVIALFYTPDLDFLALAAAIGGLAVVGAMRALNVWWTPAYAAVAIAVWLATLLSGVHATIAGVALGLLVPVRALNPGAFHALFDRDAPERLDPSDVRAARLRAQASVSVAERLAHDLHPWTGFVVVPLFALANAGVDLGGSSVVDAIRSPVALGIVLGLVVGKLAGITLFSWLAVRARVATLPMGFTWAQLGAVAAIAGIGFTVSLFITGLAFDDPQLVSDAKVGIVAASLLATVIGALGLRIAVRARPRDRERMGG
jgi:Na+:H+ antiporter, NhaA family